MTYEDAVRAMIEASPVIYTGDWHWDLEYEKIVDIQTKKRNGKQYFTGVVLADYCGHSTVVCHPKDVILKEEQHG